MSAQHHDLEQSPATHDRVTSVSLSPQRRDPEPDADDSFTRKRQRMDDGGAVLRAISTDPESPSKAIMSPHKEMVAMTIREHSPSSLHSAQDKAPEHITPGPLSDRASTPTRSPVMFDGACDDPASSPLIEIIDDGEDNLSANISVQFNAEDFFTQFPYGDRFDSALQAVRGIADYVQKSM